MQELTAEAVAGVIEINPRIIAPITAELAADAGAGETVTPPVYSPSVQISEICN